MENFNFVNSFKDKKNNKVKLYKSFSLFELLIYITILISVVLFISQIIFPIKKIERNTEATLEIERNINSILNIISYNIRLATSVNLVLGSNLSLKMADSSINPTVFSLSKEKVYIQQGNDPNKYALNNDKVYVDSLNFEEISSQPPAKESIKISFTLHYNGPGKGVTSMSRKIESTISLR